MRNLYYFLLLLAANFTVAQSPYLVKDLNINMTPREQTHTSLFSNSLAEIDGVIYFTRSEDNTGSELWRTNGTEQETFMVKDIKPGKDSSTPKGLTQINDFIYFIANNDELWKSDGTEDGTSLIKKLQINDTNNFKIKFVAINNSIYILIGSAHQTIFQLWKTDGTENGTLLLKKFYNTNNNNNLKMRTAVLNDELFFIGTDDIHGLELWKTNGTIEGTTLVKDINIGKESSKISYITTLNNTLFFDANNDIDGIQLWKSDGTNEGTTIVKNITPASGVPRIDNIITFSNTIYFTSGINKELWKSDGTEQGTIKVKENITIRSSHNSPITSKFTKTPEAFFFGANRDYSLWKSDGTEQGTKMVKNFDDGISAKQIVSLTYGNGELFIILKGANNIRELWTTDGTEENTKFIKNINPHLINLLTGQERSQSLFSNETNNLYFFSNSNNPISGLRLWKSDGTTNNTNAVKSRSKLSNESNSSNLSPSININDKTVFLTNDGIWQTDGTEQNTSKIKELNIPCLTDFNVYDNNILFSASDGISGVELWKSNGTKEGTVLIKDIHPGVSSSSIDFETSLIINSELYFVANDGIHGTELWKSDGTENGTLLIKNIGPESFGSINISNTFLKTLNNEVLFIANDRIHGDELWKTNGTEEGTILIKDINEENRFSGSSINLSQATLNPNTSEIYFTANDGIHGKELWKTDGTEEGTTLIKDINQNNISKLKNFNNWYYFTAENSVWKTDGTNEGTTLIDEFQDNILLLDTNDDLLFLFTHSNAEIKLWKFNSANDTFSIVKSFENKKFDFLDLIPGSNEKLFFSLTGTDNSKELWVTNFTNQGTISLINLKPTFNDNEVFNIFWNINNTGYFSINNGIYGKELWKTDGTKEGTLLIHDIAEGAASSDPNVFSESDGVIYFSAFPISSSGFLYGRELMAFGHCAPNNKKFDNAHPIENVIYNSEAIPNSSTETCHCNIYNELLNITKSSGNNPIADINNNTVYIATNSSPAVVKRHYEIAPKNNIANTTGGLTLYFTQDEFNAFNKLQGQPSTTENNETSAFQFQRLPTSPTDLENIANVRILVRKGISNDGSGHIDSYPDNSTVIDPVDTNIIWNANENIWEVSFDTESFGGFWLTSADRVLSTTQTESSKLTLSPNPTTSYVQFNGLKQKEPFTIYNMLGVAVQKGTAQNNTPISTAQLTQGLYILELDNGTSFKIIKR